MATDTEFLFLGGRLFLDLVNTEIVVLGKYRDLISDSGDGWHGSPPRGNRE